MTQARKHLVSVSDTPYYHIVSRCVRRTFLCGFDQHSGRDYEHRRQWIVDRIRLLSSVFAIDICSYAIMSNHYHLVVKLDPKQTQDWTHQDIVKRWTTLFKGPLLVQRWQARDQLSPAELDTVSDILTVWQKRLTDLSWFMKCLNEPIARQANQEDHCTGHFWESRFKSQALLTEEALLSCMAYVDLNPIRANLAQTPESSDYTSIQERIQPQFNLSEAIQSQTTQEVINDFHLPLKPLLHFSGPMTNEESTGIPFSLDDYLELVDWTGRAIRPDKSGYIHPTRPLILKRLNLQPKDWLINTTQFEQRFRQQFRRRQRQSFSDTG